MSAALRWIVAALSAAVFVVVLAATAGATTTRIPITATETLEETVEVGTSWQVGNTLHWRGEQNLYRTVSTSDYLTGYDTVTSNGNANLVTGDAVISGTWDIELDEFDGGFAGPWSVRIEGGEVSGHIIGQGYGELSGWQIRLAPAATAGIGLEGFLFSPADKDE